MGRHADPSPRWNDKRQQWVVRITERVGEPSRPHHLPAEITQGMPEDAKRFAVELSDRLRAQQSARPGETETVSDYAGRWIKARTGRVASVGDNRAHLERHILPVIGWRTMADVTAAHVEAVVESLDAKVTAGALNAKTARNVWGTCSKMFDDATHAKPSAGLRCLAADPTCGVRGPDDDAPDKALQFLYPSEFMSFVLCEDVPLAWRRNVAVAIYLCLRDGEQRALKWSAIDLDHGMVTVSETFDRRAGEVRDGTKSGAARVVPIHPALMPLLTVMHEESGGKGLVCDLPSYRDMARGLRDWLRNAGVVREQLHKGTSVSKQIRWHDLRATGATWLAVEGRPPTEIRDVLGHTQTSMTDRYTRAAGILRGGRFGVVFPALPGSLTRPPTSGGGRPDSGDCGPFAVFAESKYAKLCGADGTRRRVEDVAKRRDEAHDPSAKQGDPQSAHVVSPETFHDASQRSQPEASDSELVDAITRACLDGRDLDRELLTRVLRERRHERAGVIVLPTTLRRVE